MTACKRLSNVEIESYALARSQPFSDKVQQNIQALLSVLMVLLVFLSPNVSAESPQEWMDNVVSRCHGA